MKARTTERLIKLLIIIGFVNNLKQTNPFMFNMLMTHALKPGQINDKLKMIKLDDINIEEVLKNPLSILSQNVKENRDKVAQRERSSRHPKGDPKTIFQKLTIPGVTREKANQLDKWAKSYKRNEEAGTGDPESN